MDFGELKNDTDFVDRVTDLDTALEEVKKQVQMALEMDSTKMSKEERIKHELFLCYSTNTLYFLYLKINGVDTTKHPIKNELSRIRQAMLRDKQIEERKTIRPRLDVPAAGRFIRHELWEPKDKKDLSKEND